MSGTREGGLKAAESNRANDPNFYKKIGTLGGSVKHQGTRYFYLNPDAASAAGRKGGTISKRRTKMEPDNKAIDERLWELYVSKCEQSNIRPRIKDYLIWLEESYP